MCCLDFGRPPRRAIPFRTDEPFPKLRQVFGDPDTPGKDCEKLEFLADGQQFIVDGIHPETLKPYVWFGGSLLEIKRAELPYIHPEEAKALFDDAVRLLVEEFGYRLRTERRNGAGAEAHQAGADWQILFDNIREGHSLHDSLRDLAAKMVKAGTHAGAAVNQLRALMEASAAERDDRWRERFARDSATGIERRGEARLGVERNRAALCSSRLRFHRLLARPHLYPPRDRRDVDRNGGQRAGPSDRDRRQKTAPRQRLARP